MNLARQHIQVPNKWLEGTKQDRDTNEPGRNLVNKTQVATLITLQNG